MIKTEIAESKYRMRVVLIRCRVHPVTRDVSQQPPSPDHLSRSVHCFNNALEYRTITEKASIFVPLFSFYPTSLSPDRRTKLRRAHSPENKGRRKTSPNSPGARIDYRPSSAAQPPPRVRETISVGTIIRALQLNERQFAND